MKTNTLYLCWKDWRHDSKLVPIPSPTKDQICTYIRNMNNWAIIQIFGLKYSDILHKSILVPLGLNY